MKEKIKNIFKNKYFRLSLILIGILVVSFLIINRKPSQPVPKPTTTPIATTRPTEGLKPENISPGNSTLEDLKRVFGEPQGQIGNSYLFKSVSPTRSNEAVLSDGRLTFFREVMGPNKERTIDELQRLYGQEDKILYNEFSGGGYNLYAYPQKGVAYVGKPKADVLLEVWYFIPTTYESFKETFAPDYSETPEDAYRF